MLCKPVSTDIRRSPPGQDRIRLLTIRDKIRVVFGRESTMDDSLLSTRYSLTEDGDLIMIIR